MQFVRIAAAAVFTIIGFSALAAPAAVPTMSGYSAAQFGDFEHNWKLVTVRYRKDTGEMRFIYANPSAWSTLSRNRTDYEDGAVFAKIGVATQADLAFPSSMTPSGARRMQFMVRNKSKHAETDGWGYALFDADGKRFPEGPDTQVAACAACHRLVADRGFVFARPMSSTAPAARVEAAWVDRIKFEDRATSALPQALRARVPSSSKSVRALQGELAKHSFFGTLDEIRPILAQETIRSRKPSVLVPAEGNGYSAVLLSDDSKICQGHPGGVALHGIHSLATKGSAPFETTFCDSPAR